MADPALHTVAVTRGGSEYPDFPYAPAEAYPEYPGRDLAARDLATQQAVLQVGGAVGLISGVEGQLGRGQAFLARDGVRPQHLEVTIVRLHNL